LFYLQVQYHKANTLPELFSEVRKISRSEPRLAVVGFGPESLIGYSRESFRNNITLAIHPLDELVEQGATVLWPLSEPGTPGVNVANDSVIEAANREASEV